MDKVDTERYRCLFAMAEKQIEALSALLWNLLSDSMLTGINTLGVYCRAYFNDVVGLVVRRTLKDVCHLFERS